MPAFLRRSTRASTSRAAPAMLDVRLLTEISASGDGAAHRARLAAVRPRIFPARLRRVRRMHLPPRAGARLPPQQEPAPRRAQRCQELEMRIATPSVDEERVALYRKWHASREAACGWEENGLDRESYRRQFCFPHPCAREMTYWSGARLWSRWGWWMRCRARFPRSIFSSIPDFARFSPGVFSALCEISLARQLGKEHVYFGYCVPGCKSLTYKALFRPHEVLVGRPGTKARPPRWRRTCVSRADRSENALSGAVRLHVVRHGGDGGQGVLGHVGVGTETPNRFSRETTSSRASMESRPSPSGPKRGRSSPISSFGVRSMRFSTIIALISSLSSWLAMGGEQEVIV